MDEGRFDDVRPRAREQVHGPERRAERVRESRLGVRQRCGMPEPVSVSAIRVRDSFP